MVDTSGQGEVDSSALDDSLDLEHRVVEELIGNTEAKVGTAKLRAKAAPAAENS